LFGRDKEKDKIAQKFLSKV